MDPRQSLHHRWCWINALFSLSLVYRGWLWLLLLLLPLLQFPLPLGMALFPVAWGFWRSGALSLGTSHPRSPPSHFIWGRVEWVGPTALLLHFQDQPLPAPPNSIRWTGPFPFGFFLPGDFLPFIPIEPGTKKPRLDHPNGPLILADSPLYLAPFRLRSTLYLHLRQWVQRRFPRRLGGLTQGFILGDTSELEEGEVALLSKGLQSHLLAVSGFHLVVFMGIIAPLFWLFPPTTGGGLVAAFSLTLVFTWVFGFRPAVIRSALMGLVATTHQFSGASSDALHRLHIGYFLAVSCCPWLLMKLGFWLSLAAVIGILFLQPPIEKILPKLPWGLSCFFSTGYSAALATLPILLFFFPPPGAILFLLQPLITLVLILLICCGATFSLVFPPGFTLGNELMTLLERLLGAVFYGLKIL